MENTKSVLESCAELTMEELEALSLTKIVRGKEGEKNFIGLGIMDEKGYLLEYEELKKVYAGLNYFIRNVSPELIDRMNSQKYQEDKIQSEKNDLIELVSNNIVDKEEWEEEEEEEEEKISFFKRIFRRR